MDNENDPFLPKKDVSFTPRIGHTMTPYELCLNMLGYIPANMPNTWDGFDAMFSRMVFDGVTPRPKWGEIPTFKGE